MEVKYLRFHLYNVGGLVVGGTVFPPCTPYGVLKLLQHENISLEGKNVVVVGASNIVGKPMALMLMQHGERYAERGLESGDAKRSALKLLHFFVLRMGSMIGGNHVKCAIFEAGDEGLDVGFRPQGRRPSSKGVD